MYIIFYAMLREHCLTDTNMNSDIQRCMRKILLNRHLSHPNRLPTQRDSYAHFNRASKDLQVAFYILSKSAQFSPNQSYCSDYGISNT
jgi:hypothetical protein